MRHSFSKRSLIESLTPARGAVGAVAAASVLAASPALAVAKSWNSAVDSTWNVASNWTSPGVPGVADDVTLGNILGTFGTRTTLDTTASVNTLTMLNGNELATGNFEFVADSADISGASTLLLINERANPANDSFDVDFLDVSSNATVRMLGGRLEIDGNTGDGRLDVTGSTLVGFGNIDLEAPGAGNKFILSDSTMSVGYTADGLVLLATDPARTLTINGTDAGATIDLDQTGSVINFLPAGTLDNNVAFAEPFSSTMNFSRKSTLDNEDAWTFNGTMNINTQAGILALQTAGPATIAGATMTQSGGSIVLDNAADHLIFDAPFVGNGGTITSNVTGSLVEFHANATLNNGHEYVLGINNTTIIDGATVTVNDDDFNMDGTGGSDWVLRNGGRLNTRGDNIDTGGSDDFGGTITFGGTGNNVVDFDVADNLLSIQSIVVEANASGEITSASNDNIEIRGNANIAAGGNLYLDSNSITFANNGGLSGDGKAWFQDPVIVADDTTFSVTNLDIDQNNGSLTVNPDATLTITSSSIEQVNTVFLINSGTANVSTDYSFGSTGELRFFDLGASNPVYTGSGEVTFNSGSLLTNGSDGGNFDSDGVFNEGSIIRNTAANSILFLGNGGETITLAGGDIEELFAGSEVQPEGTLEVTGNSSVAVTTFDWDQAGNTNIRAGGELNVNVTNLDNGNNQHDSTINFDGGVAIVNTGANSWTAEGIIRSTSGGALYGDRIFLGNDTGTNDADIDVNGGFLNIGAPVTVYSDAEINVAAGSTLKLGSSSTVFAPVNGAENATITGAGKLHVVGATFNEATTFDMTGGTVQLDGSLSANSTLPTLASAGDNTINAFLTINAATMDDYGYTTALPAATSELHIGDIGRLTVNLDNPNDEWTVLSNGVINYNGNASGNTFLAGSDINFNGTLNVNGDGNITARVDFGAATVNINTVGEDLLLTGGSHADPNTMSGTTFNGPGQLDATTNDALHGHGTINAPIDFNGDARLIAEDGTLTINGPINDVGRIGTLDSGPNPVLNITNAWNTNVAQEVLLQGGELAGATVTNDLGAGIVGFGTISAQVVNNTTIDAVGGNLTVDEADWDGTTETGSLRALSGDLKLTSAGGSFGFDGTVQANNGRTVIASGFELDFQPASSLILNGGTYNSTANHDIRGQITTNTAPGTIQVNGGVTIHNTANATLNTDLVLDNTNTLIQSGATFSGAGSLVNPAGSTLTTQDGVDLGVLLQNDGTLVIGTSPGRLDTDDYVQSATGSLEIEIGGAGLGQFDRLIVDGNAQLAGNIDLSVLGGFNPTLYSAFSVIQSLGLGGTTFDTWSGANYAAGRMLNVTYTADDVIIVPSLAGDIDLDGDVDGVDLGEFFGAFTGPGGGPTSNPATDLDGDGDTDGVDLGIVFGYFTGPSAPVAIPEPTSLALLALGGLTLARRRRI